MTEKPSLQNKLSFKLSPLLELALSLLVIESPERFEPLDPWVTRVVGRVPGDLVSKLRDSATTTDYLALACDFEQAGVSITAALQQLRFSDPDRGELLTAFWEALAPEVAANVGALGDSVQRENGRLRTSDPAEFISDFSDRIQVSEDGQELILDWGRGMRVNFDRLEQLWFVPSLFCPRRLMFYRHGATQIFFYNPLERDGHELPEPPESLVLGFTALSDPTRLKLLKLIAREKLPAQEMARTLDLHESTVSRHLKFLIEAGHVAREKQEGKYIFYTLNMDRIHTLLATFRTYLSGSTKEVH